MGDLLKAAEFYLKAGDRALQKKCIRKLAQVDVFSIVFAGRKKSGSKLLVDQLRSIDSSTTPFYISLLSNELNEDPILSSLSLEQDLMLKISSLDRAKDDPSISSWIRYASTIKIVFDSLGGLIRKLTGMLHYGIASEEIDALFALRRSSASDEERLVSRVIADVLKVKVKDSSWSFVPLSVIVPAAISFLKTRLKELIPKMLRAFNEAMESGKCKYHIDSAFESRGYLIFADSTCLDPR
jgi:hypothetical protein